MMEEDTDWEAEPVPLTVPEDVRELLSVGEPDLEKLELPVLLREPELEVLPDRVLELQLLPDTVAVPQEEAQAVLVAEPE